MSRARRRWPMLALLALLACDAPAPPRAPNVLLIVADTLRADRLGAYGDPRGLTPFLDGLASRSTLFRRVVAQSPYTDPSVASLFTSRYPSQHGVVWLNSGLHADEVTLAELLRERGYRTGGFSANPGLSRKRGFAQGFEEFRHFELRQETKTRWIKTRAPVVNRAALAWLDALAEDGAPVFLYVHYMETHLPFSPPPTALRRIFGDGPVPDIDAANLAHLNGRDTAPDDAMKRHIDDLYAAEIASLDADLGALFGELERRGFLEDALVVFTSDHGEEFFERGFSGHGHTLYDELIRVPLLVQAPGQTRGREVDRLVSLVDVAPTILSMLGAAAPDRFEGHALMAGGDSPPRAAFSELMGPQKSPRTPHERAVIAGSQKLIVRSDAVQEFYDLRRDPGERRPTALDDAAREALRRRLDRFVEEKTRSPSAAPDVPLEDAQREQLRALGYGD